MVIWENKKVQCSKFLYLIVTPSILNFYSLNWDRVQECVKSAQSNVVNVQNKLDQVVSSFGNAMQAGMQKCQADAQQLMASGGAEKGNRPTNHNTPYIKRAFYK